MKVFKFGGASTADVERIRSVADIIAKEQEPLFIVASATGKSTNRLEQILEIARENPDKAAAGFDRFFETHAAMARQLMGAGALEKYLDAAGKLQDEGLRWLQQSGHMPYAFVYDQFVSLGELLSTRLLSAVLHSRNIRHELWDARQLILCEGPHRLAKAQMQESCKKINRALENLREDTHVLVQGFIGGSEEGYTSTLGREGSDYSAALFAACAGASELCFWKDVPGILNADPNFYVGAVLLDKLSYRDALEISRLGAKVIHPKSIKPLEEKGIPLRVRSFLHPENPGTLISAEAGRQPLPPIIIERPGQVFIRIEKKKPAKTDALQILEEALPEKRLRTVLHEDTEKTEFVVPGRAHLLHLLEHSDELKKQVRYTPGLSLLIVRGAGNDLINQLTANAEVLRMKAGPEAGLVRILLRKVG